jgi:hypothetical protein
VPQNQPVRPEIAYFNPNQPASQVRNPFLNVVKPYMQFKGILKNSPPNTDAGNLIQNLTNLEGTSKA